MKEICFPSNFPVQPPLKFCCFRFDADTHACVSEGIPRLAELGACLGVRFTFFVNMGRAFDPRITFLKAVGRLFKGGRRGSSLSAAKKLGWRAALKAAVLNPQAGRSDPAALREAVRAGHELGLHGGRNHAQWERSARNWSEARLRREVQTGLRWFAECGLPAPVSFASPAWNSPEALRRVLPAHGFQFLADTYDAAQTGVTPAGELCEVPTNLTVDPGSAGYLETLRLRGWSTGDITRHFRSQLLAQDRLAVVYDHPFFAGTHALEQVGELVRVAQDTGFAVETIRAAARGLSRAGHPAAVVG